MAKLQNQNQIPQTQLNTPLKGLIKLKVQKSFFKPSQKQIPEALSSNKQYFDLQNNTEKDSQTTQESLENQFQSTLEMKKDPHYFPTHKRRPSLMSLNNNKNNKSNDISVEKVRNIIENNRVLHMQTLQNPRINKFFDEYEGEENSQLEEQKRSKSFLKEQESQQEQQGKQNKKFVIRKGMLKLNNLNLKNNNNKQSDNISEQLSKQNSTRSINQSYQLFPQTPSKKKSSQLQFLNNNNRNSQVNINNIIKKHTRNQSDQQLARPVSAQIISNKNKNEQSIQDQMEEIQQKLIKVEQQNLRELDRDQFEMNQMVANVISKNKDLQRLKNNFMQSQKC